MFKVLVLLCFLFCGCTQSYLAKKPSSPLKEKVITQNTQNALETIQKLSTRINSLEREKKYLTEQHKELKQLLADSKNKEKSMQKHVEKLEKQCQFIEQKMKVVEKMNKVQEEEILDLNIGKIRMEQSILKLKIKSLKRERQIQ